MKAKIISDNKIKISKNDNHPLLLLEWLQDQHESHRYHGLAIPFYRTTECLYIRINNSTRNDLISLATYINNNS